MLDADFMRRDTKTNIEQKAAESAEKEESGADSTGIPGDVIPSFSAASAAFCSILFLYCGSAAARFDPFVVQKFRFGRVSRPRRAGERRFPGRDG
ncbi:MAG TPA: hypothetical protein VL475_11140 [Planctomycetaceae bacterium]|nr:hypothetical protein [Planctomycetaceae bacterium]